MTAAERRLRTLTDRARALRDDLQKAATDAVGTDIEDRLWSAWDQAGDVIEELTRGY